MKHCYYDYWNIIESISKLTDDYYMYISVVLPDYLVQMWWNNATNDGDSPYWRFIHIKRKAVKILEEVESKLYIRDFDELNRIVKPILKRESRNAVLDGSKYNGKYDILHKEFLPYKL